MLLEWYFIEFYLGIYESNLFENHEHFINTFRFPATLLYLIKIIYKISQKITLHEEILKSIPTNIRNDTSKSIIILSI